MENPALKEMDYYFDGKEKFTFDGFHHYYYLNTDQDSDIKATQARVKVAWSAFSETSRDLKTGYIPCGISSGFRQHEMAAEQNRKNNYHPDKLIKTTHKLDHHLGSPRLRDEGIMPNVRDNLIRSLMATSAFPDVMFVPPVMFEAAAREMSENHAFSRGQKFEEQDFMSLWYPVIDHCKVIILEGDWNFSRNAIWEMMRGTSIQAGLVPTRPDADMDMIDFEGNSRTFRWRAQKLAEYIKYAVVNGIEPREGATALAWMFQIDDWLRDGTLDLEKIHPTLGGIGAKAQQRMDTLKKEMKPFLLKYCAPYMILKDLPEDYAIAAKKSAGKKPVNPTMLPLKLKEEAEQIRQTALRDIENAQRRARFNAQAHLPTMRRYDPSIKAFSTAWNADIFEDDLYAQKLSERERAALPFILGALETPMMTANRPYASFVFYDMKRGARGMKAARAEGVVDLAELPGKMGKKFAQQVWEPNYQEAEKHAQTLKREDPERVVLSTPACLRIFDAAAKNPEYVAAEGEARLGPEARLAFYFKILERSVDDARFQDGWETSNDLCQLMVRATLIQMGLIDRPSGENTRLDVRDMDGNKMSLADRIIPLARYVETSIKNNVEVPEAALALARLLEFHDMLADHRANKPNIAVHQVDQNVTSYLLDKRYDDVQRIRAKIRPILLKECVRYIPRERLKDLSPDYDAKKEQYQNEEILRRSRSTADEVLHRKHGPSR